MKQSLWDLKPLFSAFTNVVPLIMKQSLWDLKPVATSLFTMFNFDHEAVPMGFETCKAQQRQIERTIMKQSLWDLKLLIFSLDRRSPGIMKQSLWDLKLGNIKNRINHRYHEAVPMGFETHK